MEVDVEELGRKVVATCTLALLWLLTGSAAYAASKQRCSATPLASVTLAVDGPTLVPVTLNGHPAWLILETAAALTLIGQDAVDTLQLATHGMGEGIEVTVGGRSVTRMVSAGPISIGGLRIARTDFLVDPFPRKNGTYEGKPVAGSLAMDMLWPYDFELDLANKKLALYSQNTCGGPAAPWADHFGRMPMDLTAVGDIYFTVEIEGKKLETSIATSADSRMGVDIAHRLSASSHGPTDSNGPDSIASGSVLTRLVRLASGDLVIPEQIRLTPAPAAICKLSERPDGVLGYDGCYGGYPLVLGREALRKLHLYFATKEKMIYFTAADVQ